MLTDRHERTPEKLSELIAVLQARGFVQGHLGLGARVYRITAQTIATLTSTAIAYSGATWDTGGFFTLSSPTRLTIPADGIYAVSGHVAWASNVTGWRHATIRVNGLTNIAIQSVNPAASGAYVTVKTIDRFSANDYLEMTVFQNSGGDLNVTRNADYSPEFAIARVG